MVLFTRGDDGDRQVWSALNDDEAHVQSSTSYCIGCGETWEEAWEMAVRELKRALAFANRHCSEAAARRRTAVEPMALSVVDPLAEDGGDAA